jgi:hypothetical protein
MALGHDVMQRQYLLVGELTSVQKSSREHTHITHPSEHYVSHMWHQMVGLEYD